MVWSGSMLLLTVAATVLLIQPKFIFGLRAGMNGGEEALTDHDQGSHKPGKKKQNRGKKKKHSTHKQEEKEMKSKLPAVLLSDIQHHDRDLGDAVHLLPHISSLTSKWAEVGTALNDLDPQFISDVSKIAPSGTDLKQRLRLKNLLACNNASDDKFVTFNGKFVGRHGFTTVRLDYKGVGQIYASVIGHFSNPLSDDDRWDEAIPPGGNPVKLMALSGLEEKRGRFYRPRVLEEVQHVFDRLNEVCMQSGKPPQLEVELQWATSRGEKLLAFPKKVDDLKHTLQGLSEGNPLLEVHGAAKDVLTSLLHARYAWHPAFALELEADLQAVQRKVGDAMGRLDRAVNGTKELVHLIIDKMNDVVTSSGDALGGSWKKAHQLRQEVPEDWQPAYVGALMDPARKKLKDTWAQVVFAYAPLASAFARTVRLLTLGAPVAVEVEDSLKPNISDLGNVTHEEDYDFLRAFVMADLDAHAASHDDTLDIMWERINSAGQLIKEGIWMAYRTSTWDGRSIEKRLRRMQQDLRSLSAFGYPALLHVAETTTNPDKKAWARQWSKLRNALDFTVWPAGSEAQKMIMPRLCQSTFQPMGTATQARFPVWMGGKAITHEFLIFAGGELPDRTPCQKLLRGLVKDFPSDAEARTKHVDSVWSTDFRKVSALGCLGYEGLGQTGGEIYHDMQHALMKLREITFSIKLPVMAGRVVAPAKADGTETYEEREVTVKVRRSPDEEFLARDIVRYMAHAVTKYSSKLGDSVIDGAKASLRRNPPFFSAEQLSNPFRSQLTAAGIPSPYTPDRCRYKHGVYECDDWNSKVPGYWYKARIAGKTLDAALDTLEATLAKRRPGDLASIAQSPATYAAVGFDSPGVIDNGDWECQNTTQICEVHPKCGRIAAQMLQYPFAGNKQYASRWQDKVITYVQAAEAGILSSLNNFYFDSDGYHGYCHSPGTAYCWSYTACLREMFNWLCSQPETSEQCCPNQEVRNACKKDVNDEGCNVCWDAIQPEMEFNESADYIYKGEIRNETLEFIHPDASDLALREAMANKQAAEEKCDVCAYIKEEDENSRAWAFISNSGACAKKPEICAEVCGFDEPLDEIDDLAICNKDELDSACEMCE
eukprot:TRINITY_DN60947_c0_g1_i1.p1 TRINITY_DN60947_c0_g1~~TRINITY_DN60947_c0_g1_i1.p1  ORF type:complete len:1132 (-),score=226.49 TRINITY_DN60947_c0_g1_i1:59-3388(-)